MDKKPLIVVSLCAVVLLVLGSSVPVVARTQLISSKTIPSVSISLAENYEVYIGAGIFREHGGKFGFGWNMTVINTGEQNISGVFHSKTTTLSGKVLFDEFEPFYAYPGWSYGCSGWTLELHPINFINLTIVVENMTYSKYGYEIGPFVLLGG
jgi:hypothetical protein